MRCAILLLVFLGTSAIADDHLTYSEPHRVIVGATPEYSLDKLIALGYYHQGSSGVDYRKLTDAHLTDMKSVDYGAQNELAFRMMGRDDYDAARTEAISAAVVHGKTSIMYQVASNLEDRDDLFGATVLYTAATLLGDPLTKSESELYLYNMTDDERAKCEREAQAIYEQIVGQRKGS